MSAPTLVLLLAGCATDGREEVPERTATDPNAAVAAVPAVEPRPVRIVTSIRSEDGRVVDSGMHFTCLLPDGRELGGGSTSSPMDIDAVEGARARISVSEEGYVPVLREFTVPGGSETHREEIVLRRVREWASLRIRIQSEERDFPETVTLELNDLAGATIKPFYGFHNERLEVDGERCVTLGKVPPGEFRIVATAGRPLETYLLPTTAIVKVEEGRRTEFDLRFEAGGRVLLRLPEGNSQDYWKEGPNILDAGGEQVGGLLWGMTRPGNWRNPPPRPGNATHENGIPPGNYRIEFGPKEARRIVKEVEVRARETTEVDLTEGK